MSKSALGRGLGALLSKQSFGTSASTPSSPFRPQPESSKSVDDTGATPKESILQIELATIHPSPLQPRRDFPSETLSELADSIRQQGVIQPLVVREDVGKGTFELIAGERRWRASQMAGLSTVPVVVKKVDDTTVLEWMLIENLQREGLNAIEEAKGYAQLIEQFQLRQEDVALKVGKSRVAVANALRLLKLSASLQSHIRDGRISVGHAKVLLSLPTHQEQDLAADKVIRDALNVRQTENLVASLQQNKSPGTKGKLSDRQRDIHLADLADRIQQRLGTKVQLRYKNGKGAVEIKFFSDDELTRILETLGVNPD